MRTVFTFGDLLRHGDAAARTGTPVTPRWAHGRAALLLLQHVCGDLDRILVGDFNTTFPDDIAALEPALAQRFPSAHSYRAVRREIPQLLSLMGMGLDDGWDSIRTLARVHHGERAFQTLVYLATPAREAGLKPSEVTPAWAFAHDAGLRRSRRWCFRKSLRILDALFDVPEVAASGLLPATQIGSPPVYDRDGSVRGPLPPRLAALCAASTSPAERRFVRWLWTTLRRADWPGLPLDPSADDLLMPAVLDRIEALRPDGIEGSTFGIYRTGAVRVLRAHATRPCGARRFRNTFPPDGLPAYLSTACAQAANPGECSGLRGLWKAIRRAGGLGLAADPSADDLLAPATWVRIATLSAEGRGLTAETFGTYRRAARRLLRRHATGVEGPTPLSLPPRLSEIHAAALSKGERTGVNAIWRAILRIEDTLTDDPSADEVLAPEVWARVTGLPPEALGLAPSTWKTYRAAAARALRRHAASPAEQPAKSQPPRQDRRRRGNMALPVALAAELDALLDLMGYAPNSQRALRSIVARRFTSAHESGVVTMAATLKDLLEVHGERPPETGAAPRQQAAVEGLRAAMRLAEAPAWRELQSAVVAAGVVPVDNPVPALFEAAGETYASPRDLTREWAWGHECGLRPDLRVTFSADIDRLDALRAVPALTGSELLPPEPLGPMPLRGGRHIHAVYPLPRPIEAAVAELDVPDAERRSVEASVHFVWRQARDAGLHAAGDAPIAEELLSEATVGQLQAMATGRAQRDAWREHMPRLRTLVPVEEKLTPRARWEALFAAARTLGLSPAALVPIYVVKAAALTGDLGPDELTRPWAVAAVAATPRAGGNALNRGLRILDALREAMPPGLLSLELVSDGRPVKLR